jgi:hypothetical protein
MVIVQVSSIQPNTTLRVAQVASPLSIFFTEAGSWRWTLSWSSKGRKTTSRPNSAEG